MNYEFQEAMEWLVCGQLMFFFVAAKAASEEHRRAAEMMQTEAQLLREHCNKQKQAISHQQDKENQWKASSNSCIKAIQ